MFWKVFKNKIIFVTNWNHQFGEQSSRFKLKLVAPKFNVIWLQDNVGYLINRLGIVNAIFTWTFWVLVWLWPSLRYCPNSAINTTIRWIPDEWWLLRCLTPCNSGMMIVHSKHRSIEAPSSSTPANVAGIFSDRSDQWAHPLICNGNTYFVKPFCGLLGDKNNKPV